MRWKKATAVAGVALGALFAVIQFTLLGAGDEVNVGAWIHGGRGEGTLGTNHRLRVWEWDQEVQHWTVGYKFGEALHPGPYSEGGASSSGMAPEAGRSQRSKKEGATEEGGGGKRARGWTYTAQRGDRWRPSLGTGSADVGSTGGGGRMAVDEDEVFRKQESTKSTRSGQDQVGEGRAGEVSGRAPLETAVGPGLGDTSLTGNGSEGRGDQGSPRETAKKKRRGVLASAFDHAEDEDPFEVMDAELDDGQGVPTGKGRTIDEDPKAAEREWMAMQSRQRMAGDTADLHGGFT